MVQTDKPDAMFCMLIDGGNESIFGDYRLLRKSFLTGFGLQSISRLS